MFEAILTKIGLSIADRVFEVVRVRLEAYFETKTKVSKISKEAGELKNELKEAQSDQERMAILRKISDFTDSIDNFTE